MSAENPFDQPPPPMAPDSYYQPDMYRPLTVEPDWRDRVSRKVVAIGLTALSLAGVGVTAGAYEFRHHQASATRQEAAPVHEINPITEAVSQKVQADFEAALAVDKCQTKVTVEDVTTMWQKLFTTHEAPNQTLQNLTTRSQEVTEQLSRDRAEQGFIALPETFSKLQADASNENALPLKVYEQAATDYFGKFNVTTLFDWQKQDFASPNYSEDISRINHEASPVHETELGSNGVVRSRIVNAMSSFAVLPPSIINQINARGEPAVKIVAFGSLHDKRDLGLSLSNKGIMIIDTDNGASKTGDAAFSYENSSKIVAGHEIWHGIDWNICGNLLSVAANGSLDNNDAAKESLNGSFKYGPASVDSLGRNITVDKRYISLENPGEGKVVVANDYGATNSAEDGASTMGENVLYGAAIAGLESDKRDMVIIDEKVALDLARLAKNNPAAARYFVNLFAAARVENKVDAVTDPLNNELDAYIKALLAKSVDVESDPTYLSLQAKVTPYRDLGNLLSKAIIGLPVNLK